MMHDPSVNRRVKVIVFFVIDLLCAILAVYLSGFASLAVDYPAFLIGDGEKIARAIIYWLPLNFLLFAVFRMYNGLWEYASMIEAMRLVAATFCSFQSLVIIGSISSLGVPKSCYLLVWFFLTAFALATRFFYRITRAFRQIGMNSFVTGTRKNIMIIGAGHGGNAIIREIEKDRRFSDFRVVCLIDDDANKANKFIGCAKVVGGRERIVPAAKKYHVDEIIFAIPSAGSETRHQFFGICLETSCVIKTLPSYYQIINEQVKISQLRKIDIGDLLERPQIRLDLVDVSDFICGKIVLVTGAGGSIGSELCRQLAEYGPKKLIAFDIYENNVYFLQDELKEAFPQLDMVTLIGSVCDAGRIDSIISAYRPDIVYHAAAHKHVPLMESSPNEAVKNNVFGTLNTVCAADKYGVSRFVLISTDKAVNPTNIMGATKRICEMIVQYYDNVSNTEFVAVRFGNVLGSNGSVIPVFKKQIENGGPVKVTHPDMIRYFMTIPEAVSLVLQAGTYARGGEIFILDMGDPVKVLSLAENMIRLSGHVPYKDINIEFIGLRPGEKIYEELLMSEEGLAETKNNKIFIGKPIDMDEAKFRDQLGYLKTVADDESRDIRPVIRGIVPTYNYGANIVSS